VLPNLERLATDSESEFIRNRLKQYMSPQFCDACNGKRLKPEILAVTLGGDRFTSQFKNKKIEDKRFPACPSWTFAHYPWKRRMIFSPG